MGEAFGLEEAREAKKRVSILGHQGPGEVWSCQGNWKEKVGLDQEGTESTNAGGT